MTEPLTPQREADFGSAEWLDSLTPDERLGVVQVWAEYVTKAVNHDPAVAFEGTLVHLQWLLTLVPKRLTTAAPVLVEVTDGGDR